MDNKLEMLQYVKDIGLAEWGEEINLAEAEMPGLMQIKKNIQKKNL